MLVNNVSLAKAKKEKNDEFYTKLTDIEKELRHYREHFEGKVVFCNCDDPYESNFFKYFAMNFNALKLKKLMAVSYSGSPIAGTEYGSFENEGNSYEISGKRSYKVVMTELKDVNGDGRQSLEDVKELIKPRIRYLKGDGSFDSDESIEMLKEADIVVTNPPFSRFRDFIALIMKFEKKFLVIGNKNAITYKEFFPLLMNNKAWIGFNNVKEFLIPDGSIKKFGNIGWFTNLDIKKRHERLDLYKEYSPQEFPKYDNYNAIEVSKVSDIPQDYDGVMGVPITFMDKFCPDQFIILGATESEGKGFSNGIWFKNSNVTQPLINKKKIYKRIFIRRKKDYEHENQNA